MNECNCKQGKDQYEAGTSESFLYLCDGDEADGSKAMMVRK